ncbi:MAG: MFS transporter [Planctomycetes bacterium]|nr:MFS transporter [Planctomycetota bacterium]
MSEPTLLLSQQPRALPVHWRIVIVAQLGWLSAFCTLMVTMLNAQYWSAELQLDTSATASVKAWLLGMTGAGGFVFGWIGDRVGRKLAMGAAVIFAASGAALIAFADDADALLFGAIIAGIGIGGQWASGQTLLGETVPPHLRARLGAIAQSGAPIGLILAALATALLGPADMLGWRNTELLLLSSLLLVPALAFVPESDVWREARRAKAQHHPVLGLFTPKVLPVFAAAFLVTLFAMANYWCTVTWLPEFMKKSWGLSVPGSIGWFLVFGAGSLLGYLLFSIVAARTGRRLAMSIFCLVMALGAGMLLFAEDIVREQQWLVLVFAATAGVGTGVWSCFGPLYTELFPTHLRNTAGGVLMNGTRAINLLAPLLPPLFGGNLGAGVAIGALFGVLCAAAAWLLPERTGAPVVAD